jgi:hypothetical protein
MKNIIRYTIYCTFQQNAQQLSSAKKAKIRRKSVKTEARKGKTHRIKKFPGCHFSKFNKGPFLPVISSFPFEIR